MIKVFVKLVVSAISMMALNASELGGFTFKEAAIYYLGIYLLISWYIMIKDIEADLEVEKGESIYDSPGTGSILEAILPLIMPFIVLGLIVLGIPALIGWVFHSETIQLVATVIMMILAMIFPIINDVKSIMEAFGFEFEKHEFEVAMEQMNDMDVNLLTQKQEDEEFDERNFPPRESYHSYIERVFAFVGGNRKAFNEEESKLYENSVTIIDEIKAKINEEYKVTKSIETKKQRYKSLLTLTAMLSIVFVFVMESLLWLGLPGIALVIYAYFSLKLRKQEKESFEQYNAAQALYKPNVLLPTLEQEFDDVEIPTEGCTEKDEVLNMVLNLSKKDSVRKTFSASYQNISFACWHLIPKAGAGCYGVIRLDNCHHYEDAIIIQGKDSVFSVSKYMKTVKTDNREMNKLVKIKAENQDTANDLLEKYRDIFVKWFAEHREAAIIFKGDKMYFIIKEYMPVYNEVFTYPYNFMDCLVSIHENNIHYIQIVCKLYMDFILK